MTTSYSPVAPVSAAIFTALNVAALRTLAPGGVHDVIPQNTVYPLVFFEVSKTADRGGFGTWPGHGDLSEIEVRIHAFGAQESVAECQAILGKAIELLFTTSLNVTGYRVCSDKPMPEVPILNLGDQVVAGVTVHEEVAILQLILENGS